jgi:hypothetical protein
VKTSNLTLPSFINKLIAYQQFVTGVEERNTNKMPLFILGSLPRNSAVEISSP